MSCSVDGIYTYFNPGHGWTVQGKLHCASTDLQSVDGSLRFTDLCSTPFTRKHVQTHTKTSNHAVRNAGITQFGLI